MNVFDNFLNQQFTADDVVQILSKRGIKLERDDESCVKIDYSDYRFEIFVSESRLTIRLAFPLADTFDNLCSLLAMNKVHYDRWCTKLYTTNLNRTDEETGEEKNEVWLVILYTGWCFSKSSFNKQFDFAIQALVDSANLFIEYYRDYEDDMKAHNSRIGFNVRPDDEGKSGSDAGVNGKKGKIGFV